MTDFQHQEPRPDDSVMSSGTGAMEILPSAPAVKTRSKWTAIYRVVVVSITIVMAVLWLKLNVERQKVERTLDAVMIAFKDGDAGQAYDLFATRAKTNGLSVSEFERFLQDSYLPFKEYQSLTITSIEVQRIFTDNPTVAQGTVANVAGVVGYSGGLTIPFSANLEKEAGEWRLFVVTIDRPPDTYGPEQ